MPLGLMIGILSDKQSYELLLGRHTDVLYAFFNAAIFSLLQSRLGDKSISA
jgi:hypothetical protein